MKTKLARIALALLLLAGFAAIAIDVGTANVAKVTFNIDSDQTSTSASIVWTARANGLVVIS